MLRVYPERKDFTSDLCHGLPIAVTSHRGASAFNLSPVCGLNEGISSVQDYSYDREKISPYHYQVYLDENNILVDFAPSYQSGIYTFTYEGAANSQIILNTRNGYLFVDNEGIVVVSIWMIKQQSIFLWSQTVKRFPKVVCKME